MSKRLIIVMVALSFAVAACGGGGGGGGQSMPPAAPAPGVPAAAQKATVAFTLVIPARSASNNSTRRTPKTISSSTQSVTISVNGGTPQVFNATPTTGGCAAVVGPPAGTSCSFNVVAPAGLDNFIILTYTGLNGTGTVLNAAVQTLTIESGANTAAVTAGDAVFVTSTADSGTGTLRAAIAIANANPTDSTAILFQKSGTITLTSGPLAINQTDGQVISIIGPGASTLTISGGGTQQIFSLSTSTVLDGVTLANGFDNATGGGAIFIAGAGSYAVDSSVLSNNTSTFGGGAIENYGTTLSIAGTTFGTNTASADTVGGAIDHENGTLAITGSTFNGNSVAGSQYGSSGGAIFSDSGSPVSIDTTTFSGSTATYGGAIYSYDSVTLTDVTFSTNSAADLSTQTGADGGAIDVEDGGNNVSLTVSGSTFVNNSVTCQTNDQCEGGAIAYDGGSTLGVSQSTFTSNTVAGSTPSTPGFIAYGGAISAEYECQGPTLTYSTFSGNQAGSTMALGGWGGALYDGTGDAGGTVTLTSNTFSGNFAVGTVIDVGGALVSYGSVSASSDTFQNNSVNGSSGNGSFAFGGALAAVVAVQASSETFTGNSALGGGAAAFADGGALQVFGSLTASTTTFTNNSSNSSNGSAFAGAVDAGSGGVWSAVQLQGNSAHAGGYADGGGALVGEYGGMFNFLNGNVSGNSATATSTIGAAYGGGLDLGGSGADAGGFSAPSTAPSGCQLCSNARRSGEAVHRAMLGKMLGRAKAAWAAATTRSQAAQASRAAAASARQSRAVARHHASSRLRAPSARAVTAAVPRMPQGALCSPGEFCNVTISQNAARGGTSGSANGGGLYLSESALTLVNSSSITGNTVGTPGSGGDIFVADGATLTINGTAHPTTPGNIFYEAAP